MSQGSPPAVGAIVGGVSAAGCVGNTNGVFVAMGVCVGVSVGGRGVAVGTAASVCATMVEAAAMAVFCTSTGLAVGTGSAPQALMIKVITMSTVRVEKRFILCKYLLMNLTIRIATAPGNDAVVSYDDFPVAWSNSEAAERFHVLFAGDKRSGAVIPNGAGKTTAGDN